MRKYKIICLLICLALCCHSCTSENAFPPSRYALEHFLDTTTYAGGAFSFDEKRILFSSNETGIFNAFSMSINGIHKDHKSTQLTNSTDHAISAISFFPSDDRVLYTEDQNGNEINHLYLREGNGSIRDLTPQPGARAEFYEWTHDHTSFIYGSNARDSKFMDIYEMDIETFQSKLLFQNEKGFIFGCLSPNKRYLALSKSISSARKDLYLYDIETAALVKASTQTAAVHLRPQAFSLDSNALYSLSDENHGFAYVQKLNLFTGATSIEHQEPWDITKFSFSHNGTYHVLTVNEDAKLKVKIFHHLSKARLKLPKDLEDSAVRAVISRSEEQILFSINSDVSPTNFYLYNIAKQTSKQLTHSLNAAIDANALVPAQAIHYQAADGLAIPALYYQPKEASSENKVPALIWVHGGPGEQSKRSYNYLIQYLVNQGYAILAVNNRGSSGYGKIFYSLADRRHGEIDLKDCLEGKNYLTKTGVVAPDKIGIIGGSYGGYIALAALAFYPDEMAVGIDRFGVSNWPRTLKSIPSWWEQERKAFYKKIGDPESDHDYLVSISPLFHAEKIKRPLMVVQGARDPRVLQAESDAIIDALDPHVPYRYLIFNDEGHGLTKNRNRLLEGKATLDFLETHLKIK